MSQGKSKQTTTQTRNVAPMSPQETLLQGQNMQAASAQAQALQDAIAKQNAYEGSAGYQQMGQLGGQAAQGLQGLMSNGMLPSGQQQSALQQYFQSIMAPQQQQMAQQAQQEAARRGMTVADSPIGQPYLQQLANYNAQMGGQQAGQGLQLGQNLAGMYQNTMNFGNQLQQNSMQNRLALTNAQPGSYGFGNQLANQRIQSAPVTTTQQGTQTQPWMQSVGQGLGALNQGIGAAQGGLNLYTGGGTNPVTGRGYSSIRGLMGSSPAPASNLNSGGQMSSYWG